MELQSYTLVTRDIDAVLFDLDGVVTDTASVHVAAWKEMFDAYLRVHAERHQRPFRPFDPETDYRQDVDGKPRYKGVEHFLISRGIQLPRGDPDDTPDQETICGLGNRKNALFQERLKTQGVNVFESSRICLQTLKAHGIKTAIVSSSRNCVAVLEAAGLTDAFDTRVDGLERDRLGLKGKPAPDMFLEAAQRLGVEPARAVVVEDAMAGAQAGRNEYFGLVIGVARHHNQTALQESGANIVVEDLAAIRIMSGESTERNTPTRQTAALPSALEHQGEIAQRLAKAGGVVFLDYDGTLTPIVDRPEQALLSADMRHTLERLAECCPVAIISGRDRADVQRLVQLDGLLYAGSHGFDISGPQGLQKQPDRAAAIPPMLDQAEEELWDGLDAVAGTLIERKAFSLAVHFRGVAEEEIQTVEDCVDSVLDQYPQLRKGHGKKVFELQPRLDWHKGKAVLWLLKAFTEALDYDPAAVVPVYIGDDTTDEDAFQTLAERENGIGIVVEETDRPTAAQYVLTNPDEVKTFLQQLIAVLEK